jgi:hypothetical protein
VVVKDRDNEDLTCMDFKITLTHVVVLKFGYEDSEDKKRLKRYG